MRSKEWQVRTSLRLTLRVSWRTVCIIWEERKRQGEKLINFRHMHHSPLPCQTCMWWDGQLHPWSGMLTSNTSQSCILPFCTYIYITFRWTIWITNTLFPLFVLTRAIVPSHSLSWLTPSQCQHTLLTWISLLYKDVCYLSNFLFLFSYFSVFFHLLFFIN